MKCHHFYQKFLFLSLFIFISHEAAAIDTQSAYVKLFSQKTEIILKDSLPFTRTNYEIVFKFNDEKAISLHHNYSIYYSYFDELQDLEVYTENPQPNGKTKTIHIKDFTRNNASSSGIFFDDQKEVNINFLGLTIGSEAHVTYTVITKECHFTDPMTFRYYLPIEEEIYELTVPKEISISLIEKNMPPNFVTYTKEIKRGEVKHKWIAKNVDEEKRYDDAPSRLYYTPHIIYKIEDYQMKGLTKTVSKSPADLFQWYVTNIKHINKKPSERLKLLADSITKGAITEQEKVKMVFNWVKRNIRYVAFENGMEGIIPREAELVCNKKYGDCKDMSSLQFGLLQALNIKAYLTWIGTRNIPYTYSEVPLKNTDNHMIAAVKDNGKWVFLDATDPNGIYGLPSDHIQGKQAMIYINDSSYELVMIPVIDYKTNTMKDTFNMKMEQNNLVTSSVSNYNGLIAGSIANQLYYMTERDKEDFSKSMVKRVSNNAMLLRHTIPNRTDDAHASIKLDYTIQDYIKEVGNEKYINLFLSKSFTNDQISDPERKVPVSFKYNVTDQSTYILSLPENYKLSYIPENTAFSNEHFGYTIEYQQKEGKLFCHQNLYTNFPNLLLNVDEFPKWNQFMSKLQKAYKESVILEKINK